MSEPIDSEREARICASLREAARKICAAAIDRDPANSIGYMERLASYEPLKKREAK